GRRTILARSLHFGGTRRNACTQSRRLITRRSQVQILPPLLERPWKQGLSSLSPRRSKQSYERPGATLSVIVVSGRVCPVRRPTSAPAIDVRELRVVRGGNVVLPDLSFDVPKQTVTALLGPSGSGKTTLIRAIVGVQRLAGGTVHVLGEEAG